MPGMEKNVKSVENKKAKAILNTSKVKRSSFMRFLFRKNFNPQDKKQEDNYVDENVE
jgi:hypothetical protein